MASSSNIADDISRRVFLYGVGAAAATAVTLGRGRRAKAAGDGRVFSATHDQMVDGSNVVQYDWVKAGVDACVKAMTGMTTVAAAWQALFPGVTTSKKIAIKVNCLNDSVYPQFETLRAMVTGMTQMLGGTFPAANITLFDNNLWRTGKVDACYGAGNLDGLGIAHGEDSYDAGTTTTVTGTTMYVSSAWAAADYGVCLAKMAPHQYYAGGLSGAIKNMMGAVSTASGATFTAKQSSGGFHDGAPYSAFCDLFANYAAAHLHLYVVDMLFACRHENESGWARVVKRITLSQDPVAIDAYNVDKINELGMSVVQPVTKAVPAALAAVGIGSADYQLFEPEVSLAPPPPTRAEIDRAIEEHRAGSADTAAVRELIKGYREQ